MSKLSLKNNNSSFTLTHVDGTGAITISTAELKSNTTNTLNYATTTIAEMLTMTKVNGYSCFVKDKDTGGTFIYDSSKASINNGGTIIDGWVRQYAGTVNIKWFGAVGDGVTDDTAAIQKALDGLESITGKGDEIYVIKSPLLTKKAGVSITNINFIAKAVMEEMLSIKHEYITVQDCNFDCDNSSTDGRTVILSGSKVAISNKGFDNLTVDGCYINKIGFCGVFVQADAITTAVDKVLNNKIINNRIEGVPNLIATINHTTIGIFVTTDNVYDINLAGPDIKLRDTYREKANYNSGHIITGNHIYKTRYGIGCHTASSVNISDNTCEYNTRGISVQTGSTNFSVSNNNIINPEAAGIHVAHCCASGTITSNSIKGMTFTGDNAAIDLYYGLADITVSNNVLDSAFDSWTGGLQAITAAPKYGIKLGQHCNNLNITGNSIKGYERAIFCKSTVFETTITPTDINYFNTGINGLIVSNNMVQGAYYTTVVVGKRAIFDPSVTNIYGVFVAKTANWEDTTKGGFNMESIFTGENVIKDTKYPISYESLSPAAGLTPFTRYKDCTFRMTKGETIPHVNNLTTDDELPDITGYIGENSHVNAGSAHVIYGFNMLTLTNGISPITDFLKGVDGQELTVRLFNGAVIVNDSSKIRLKNGTNITGTTSDHFVKFKRLSNIWFEISRNF